MCKIIARSSHTVVAAILIAAIMAGLAPLGKASAQAVTALVVCVAEDVYSAPDIYAPKVATMYQNQTVTVTGSTTAQGTNWSSVLVPGGASGWMKSVCLQTTGGQPGGQVPPGGAFAVVNTGALNIRSGPGIQFASIFSVFRGTVLGLIARSADSRWLKVSLDNGVVGWVNGGYVRTSYPIGSLPVDGGQVPPPTQPPGGAFATVRTGALNVRSGPGWWFPVVISVYRGTTASLLSRNADGSWVKIQLSGGQVGWVNSGYITASVGILSLPVEVATVPPPTVPTQPTNPLPTCRTYHVVAAGENLFRISLRYNVSLYTLAAVNGIFDVSRIFAGQRLCIP